ncbi:MAG TPA: hypothetical protein VFA83_18490 [Acidimicrobiales bacterium]|nr:hypothetical protein [Acidimicrobiales bacterium]
MSTAGGDEIPDEAELWRRVPPDRVKASDADPTLPAPQGNCFRARAGEDEGISVDLAAVHEAAGEGPEVMVAAHDPEWGVLLVTARQCRDLKLEVVSDPFDGNPAHALIKPPPQKTPSRQLSKVATWVVTPRWPR